MPPTTKNHKIEPDVELSLGFINYTDTLPYIRMWAAALSSGIRDYCKAAAGQGKPGDIQWFESDSSDPGSFVWMCHILNLDPGTARRRVMEREADIASINSNYISHKKDESNGEV